MDAIDRADLNARVVLRADAGLGDDISHNGISCLEIVGSGEF
jgi:hypothetical protein